MTSRAVRFGGFPVCSLLALVLAARPGAAQVLDKRALFARQTWWDNRDFDWLAARIPAFESPETRFVAPLRKATNRPSAEIEGV